MKNKLLFLVFGLLMTTQMIYSQIPSYVPANGLVGYWPFNGNANDESGNGNNGTVNGANLTTDRFGNVDKAYSFDGNSNINTNFDGVSNQNNRTMSFWYNIGTNNVSEELVMVGYGGLNAGTQFVGVVFPNNKLGVDIGASYVKYDLTTQLGWHFYTISYDNVDGTNVTSIKLFVDGQLITNVLSSFNPTITIQTGNLYKVRIGNNAPTSTNINQGFIGKIDDVGIWNRALTQQEITAMYNGVNYNTTCNIIGGTLVNGLVGYWPFCGNANDESGNGNNGTVNGATLTTDRFGNADKAYSFDGINNNISTTNNSTLSGFSDITVSAWVNISEFPSLSNGSGLSGLVTKWYGSGSCGGLTDNYALYIRYNNQFVGGTNQYKIYPNMLQSPSNLTALNWYHLVMVHNSNSGGSFYINGILVTTYTTSGVLCSSTNPLYFGCDNGVGILNRFFKGRIDDIGIWNRVLTQQEITDLYTNNLSANSFESPKELITIYPNPTNSKISIDCSLQSNLIGSQVKISTILGQEIYNSKINQLVTEIPLSSIASSGVYFVQIINAQGQIVDVKRILLQ